MELRAPSTGQLLFGIQGWDYGEVRPRGITFFLDGTAVVYDHRGNPIDQLKGTHAEVIAKLAEAGVDWQRSEKRDGIEVPVIATAGWPQLPYAELKKLKRLPPTPADELEKIPSRSLRQDALRVRRESDAEAAKQAEE